LFSKNKVNIGIVFCRIYDVSLKERVKLRTQRRSYIFENVRR